jgi:hypothetical protein
MRATIIAIFLCLSLLRTVAAGDAQFRMPEGNAYEGTPFLVTIEVTDASDVKPPVAPEIPGATVRVVERGRQSMTELRGGRVRNSTSVTYAVEITPERVGSIQIPALTVLVDGKELRSKPQRVEVMKSEAGNLLSAEVIGLPAEGYVGQPLDLILRISVRAFKDPSYGQLNESQMWQLVDLQGSEWGEFQQQVAELRQRNAAPRAQQEVRNGGTYFNYELTRRTWPPKTGTPDIGAVRIRMTYPIALREVQNLFLDRQLTISESRPLSVTAKMSGITILPLPELDRPASFSGAVGAFAIAVTAKPTTVAVGEPVTLTLAITDIRGGANLETLQPPALAADVQLAKEFRIPNEPLSGIVSGNTKRFTVTVRPLRAGTAAIPPIEYSAFDPQNRAYAVSRSQPIPITVTPANEMDLSKIVTGGASTTTDAATPGTQLTEVQGGLVANRPVTEALLADERLHTGPIELAGLVLPPVGAAVALAFRMHRTRHARDGGLARRSRARRTADARLRAATDATGLAGAITGFVEDMTGRAAGTLTRGDLERVLATAGVDHELRNRIAEFLGHCDRARYAGAATPAELAAEAQRAIDALDAARLRATNGGIR